MKKIIILTILVLFGIGYWYSKPADRELPPLEKTPVDNNEVMVGEDIPAVTVIAQDLTIPWDIAFLPDGRMLVSERPGTILLIDTNGTRTVYDEDVKHTGEGGLLGITLHPDFAENGFVYAYTTEETASGGTENRVVRFRFENDTLVDETEIIAGIPGAIYHDGGRMDFGPDGMLYITTGDATKEALAQDLNSLAGKLLRLKDDGSIPADNPFGTAVYSYGHRNSQGLAWDDTGRLWSTEHGRSGIRSGLDEINLIIKGKNYGWPTIEGDEARVSMVTPSAHSGASTTWAPASATYLNGSIFFGGLRGEALYEAIVDGDKITEVKVHFQNEFGRIRAVRVGPDHMLYITTSNRDGRGTVQEGDDNILRINPAKL